MAASAITLHDISQQAEIIEQIAETNQHLIGGQKVALQKGKIADIRQNWQKICASFRASDKAYEELVKARRHFEKMTEEFEPASQAESLQLQGMVKKAQSTFTTVLAGRADVDLRFKDRRLDIATEIEEKKETVDIEKTYPSYVSEVALPPAAPQFGTINVPASMKSVKIIVQNGEEGLVTKACNWVWTHKLPIIAGLAFGGASLAVAQHIPQAMGAANAIIGIPSNLWSGIQTASMAVAKNEAVTGALSSITAEKVVGTLSTLWTVPTVYTKLKQGENLKAFGYALTGLVVGAAPRAAQVIAKTGLTLDAAKTVGSSILSALSFGYFGTPQAAQA